jgi:hypothetical protein
MTPDQSVEPATERSRGAWIWPAAIILALAIVVAINAAFAFIAVGGQDEVVPSYTSEPR